MAPSFRHDLFFNEQKMRKIRFVLEFVPIGFKFIYFIWSKKTYLWDKVKYPQILIFLFYLVQKRI